MYIGHGRLCVYVSLGAFQRYCTDPDVTWRNGNGCPLVLLYWADLQSVPWFCCYDNTQTRIVNAKCQLVLVLALWLVCFCHVFTFLTFFIII